MIYSHPFNTFVMKLSAPLTLSLHQIYLWPKFSTPLARYGSQHDGGYLLPPYIRPHLRMVVSFGINVNWSFESSLLKNLSIPLAAYDINDIPFVISRYFFAGVYKFFFKSLSLKDFFARALLLPHFFLFFRGSRSFHVKKIDNKVIEVLLQELPLNTLLKCDIEGSEYSILDQIIFYRAKFAALIFEFHDCVANHTKLKAFIGALSDSHSIVHLHVNNYESPTDDKLLKLVELTICRNDLLENIIDPPCFLPIDGLDSPTIPSLPDILLTKPQNG